MYCWLANMLLFFTFFSAAEPWGYHTLVDIDDCDPWLIQDKEHIERYIAILCDLIDMKRFGDPIIQHFGQEKRVEGYSMFQFIETSHIAGHFANASRSIYIDVFSCKPYDQDRVGDFTASFFNGTLKSIRKIKRY